MPVAPADALPAIFSDPPPVGPITDQAADAIARLLWTYKNEDQEQATRTAGPAPKFTRRRRKDQNITEFF